MITLAMEINTDSTPDVAQEVAAIVFKNTIINATQVSLLGLTLTLFVAQEEDGNNLWFTLDQTIRGQIKDAFMARLGCANKKDVKNASICLAIIAAVEVPQGKWPEFLSLMAENSTNENFQFRLAALQTLGYMSEFIETQGTKLD